MLKTYRIIPLIFILFLFGFTLITVSPVVALPTEVIRALQDVERRIDALEGVLCNHHPESKHELCIAIENEVEQHSKDQYRKTDEELEAELREQKEKSKSFDKNPFTYSPDGSIRQSPDGKFRCIGFPKVRSWPECEKKFKEAKERTKRLFQSETGVRFPDK